MDGSEETKKGPRLEISIDGRKCSVEASGTTGDIGGPLEVEKGIHKAAKKILEEKEEEA